MVSKPSTGLELPEAPVGIPDSFEEHLNVMFDQQVLAYRTGITRVSTLMLDMLGVHQESFGDSTGPLDI